MHYTCTAHVTQYLETVGDILDHVDQVPHQVPDEDPHVDRNVEARGEHSTGMRRGDLGSRPGGEGSGGKGRGRRWE